MAFLRSFAKKILPANFRKRFIPPRERFYARSFSQEGEDMLLRRIFWDKRAGFYVDVGAHHPQRFSNTYFFYSQGWSGINIEPNPIGYELLRAQRPRDVNLQVAVSNLPDSRDYFEFDEAALNTFSPKLAAEYAQKYQLIRVTNMRFATLKQILEETKPVETKIDFLTVDAEGLDLHVLMSNDWSIYRPSIVVTESIGMNFEQVLSGEAAIYMSSQGYEPFAKTLNSVIYRDTRTTL